MKTICLVVLLLAGCATEESIRRDRETYLNSLASRCSAYGMPPGSPQMQQCMMQLDLANQQNEAASNAFLLQQGMQGLNQPAMVVPAPAPQAPSTMTCRRNAIGETVCSMR